MKVGFLVNPYAGAGGRLGYKGSDDIREENPEIPARVSRFLSKAPDVEYLTPREKMGEVYFAGSNKKVIILNSGKNDSTREDTVNSVKEMIERGADIITFVGGDGTARDVAQVVGTTIPILGVPAGVKMHSGVFASTPEAAGTLLSHFVLGRAKVVATEVLDVDEEMYRRGKYVVKLYYIAKTISFNRLLTPSKQEYSYSDELDGIADFFLDKVMKDGIVYIMGPGSTVKRIEERLGLKPNFLGIDVFLGKKLIKANANYLDLVALTGGLKLKIVLTPIGGQGFVIGRGNQEIGPEILRRIEKEDIIILSVREKLDRIDCLRFDTGDPSLDEKFKGVYRVIIGYDETMAVKTCST
ncbi:ATP-NAD kinase family protein [Metallosphaera tengchongensis]|uniref:ATP-NAD kinase family protein n=1 Tax=Metallosphaera tengchongensis TaxID=1532350 RepID=A0A6N0NTX6_9CREN|nr:ATP-NAD kinase family protein [Metallosphaera tengchongensis]QKQ99352.1 ATP-NAD kinase family protein [Metallosphaera tengchongensis]